MEYAFWAIWMPVAVFPLYGVPLSLIIWYRTKDPTNRWLKILYRCRWCYGILVLVTIIPAVINLFGDQAIGPSEAAAQFLGMVGAKFFIAWCLMRVWAKTPEPE